VRALIVGAAWAPGADSFYAGLAADHDLVVAADAAAEQLLDIGVKPDVAIGDFDSALPGAIERLKATGVRVRAFPTSKDATDLDLAADATRAAGATSVTITGAFRARLDHTLAALGTLGRLADLSAVAVEPDLRMWVADGETRPTLTLALVPGTVVSILAIGGAALGVTLRGFSYPLEDARLEPVSGLGVSNVADAASQTVALSAGTLLVVVSG